MEYVLETSALRKRYRDFTALNGLDMHIPKGSIYGFVGRNGAGKTTLIRLICGLQEPTGGSFTLYGAKNTDAGIGRCRRRMGAVVETPSIYLDMTAEENLRQQYLVLGLPSTDGIPELLHLVGLDGTGKKKAKNFSLGMRQRLGIAVALAGGPDFLVLARVLDRLGAEYRIVDDTRTDVFADVEATQLVAEAMKENCVIHSMKERDESLESFYMNLMGGAHHA